MRPAPPLDETSFGPASATVLRRRLATCSAELRDALDGALVRRLLAPVEHPLANVTLAEIRADRSPLALAADDLVADLPIGSIDDLVHAFETLASPTGDEGSDTGVVFTPALVADYLAAAALTPANAPVVDPACGCGALLVAALRRIHALVPDLSPARIIDEQIVGADVDPAALRRTGLLLSLVASLELGDDTPAYHPTLLLGDGLERDLWGDLAGTFGAVVANPPYVRFQRLPRELRARYARDWPSMRRGNVNLYFAFFELAGWLRSPEGLVAVITPNSFVRAASAQALRRWMTETAFPTRVIDFGATRVFAGAMTYVAVTVADPAASGTLDYAECADPSALADPAALSFSRVPLADLDERPWNLVAPHRRRVAAALSVGTPLAELAVIRYGIATLRDGVYLLDAEGRTRTGVLVESAATAPVVKVAGLATQADLDACTTRIIFPYRYDDTGRAVAWTEEELARYPATRDYLESQRAELARRDHGRKQYAAWFAYGRTQGLARVTTPRLLSPLYAAAPRFLLETTPGRLVVNGVTVTPRPGAPLDALALAAILNSPVLRYHVERVGAPITGGFYGYQKAALEGFRIPDAVVARIEEILATDSAERPVLLARLYGLDLADLDG